MIKLNRPISVLEEFMAKVGRKIDALEEKRDAIEDNAFEHNRDMTEREQAQYCDLDEQIAVLECELENIEMALDLLREYEA